MKNVENNKIEKNDKNDNFENHDLILVEIHFNLRNINNNQKHEILNKFMLNISENLICENIN